MAFTVILVTSLYTYVTISRLGPDDVHNYIMDIQVILNRKRFQIQITIFVQKHFFNDMQKLAITAFHDETHLSVHNANDLLFKMTIILFKFLF